MLNKYQLTDDSRESISEKIASYGGGEIFFGCNIDENGEIYEVTPICYGNEDAVLAPYELANKFNGVLHNHPSGIIQPSSADMQYAQQLKNQGIGFFIINNDASKLTTVIPPIVLLTAKKINPDQVKEIFTETMGKHKKDYEIREGQLKMSLNITDSLNENKICVIEAGTGIGKSLAYLIPAFLWAERNNERVVISTNTINLQSQILNKDIPFVKKLLDSSLNAVLVKGRRNYICKLKIYHLDSELEFSDESEELNTILNWSSTTESGTIDELNFVPSPGVWERVCSDSDFCVSNNCAFYKDCCLQRSRREASEANILIVNHHILFADVHIRSQSKGLEENILLPPYKKIIFDEAHNVEKAASSYFTSAFSKAGFYKFIGLYRGKKNKSFIKTTAKKLMDSKNKSIYAAGEYISREVSDKLDDLFSYSQELFDLMDSYAGRIAENESNGSDRKFSTSYRILKEEWNSDIFTNTVISPLKRLLEKIDIFNTTFTSAIELFDMCDESAKSKYDIDMKTFKGYSIKLTGFYNNLSELLESNQEKNVSWIDIYKDETGGLLYSLVTAPLYIDTFLNNALYKVFDSIIFTSATLTVNQNFDYFNTQSGLNLVSEKPIEYFTYQSPFDYQKQVLFVTPADIPDPRAANYNDSINNFISESIKATKGSAFVLFTSFSQLKKSYEEVEPVLNDAGYRSYYQGEMNKDDLLNRFIMEKDSCLFATDSFWEGVDAPGETLRYVILTKLPFRMPNDPIEKARVEDMEKRGINSFINYTVPQAVIRFRQGFGRLVRTKSDYGIVAVLDTRVISMPYGKTFFKSLPRCKFFSGASDMVFKSIKDHINNFE